MQGGGSVWKRLSRNQVLVKTYMDYLHTGFSFKHLKSKQNKENIQQLVIILNAILKFFFQQRSV